MVAPAHGANDEFEVTSTEPVAEFLQRGVHLLQKHIVIGEEPTAQRLAQLGERRRWSHLACAWHPRLWVHAGGANSYNYYDVSHPRRQPISTVLVLFVLPGAGAASCRQHRRNLGIATLENKLIGV